MNDLLYFVTVVRNRGFTAAARATGIEKTRLSRRVAELEKQLGVRLLHRSTRRIGLTEAGEQFYECCLVVVEEAEAAYESIASLRKEPVGTVRMTCPPVLAQTYLASILPAYLARHPMVNLHIEATDHAVDLIEDRFDLALLARPQLNAMAGIVIRNLGNARRILVAAPRFLNETGRPATPDEIPNFATLGRASDVRDGKVRWEMSNQAGEACLVSHFPRMQTNDLRLQFEAAIGGAGIALLPEPIVAVSIKKGLLEHVLPAWSALSNRLCLAYPAPRGMLPSVRSVLDFLSEHLPAVIQARSVIADTNQADFSIVRSVDP
ncbi:LysR substrate-binding domain-containing protein [Herminiimonas sp. CN]|uniref:LysR substrate-binding domain-containing protein n=1 Tax=Herminiimonas sp. CN TaxID=1349818 RepID=UPI0019309907|nr:LysR substrate-binding domain-containing protein [Herminiimonas sp. CN]